MIYSKDGKEYLLLNLEKQVQKNKADIEYIINEEGTLNQFGLRVIGQADTISNVPTVVAYKESNPNWEYGDAYIVGASVQGADTVDITDATLLVLTRANTVYPNDFWMNLGEFPKPGDKGDKGDKGLGVISGNGEPTGNAENGTTYIDSSNGDVYLRADSTWVLTGNIRGPQGIRGATGAQGVQGKIGPQGPQGLQGERGIGVNILGTLTSTSQLPDPSTVGKDSAYIIPDAGVNHLWVIEGTDNLVWTDFGTAGIGEKGDKGDAGRGIDTLTDVDLTYGNTTVTYDATNGISVHGTARFTYPDGNHDANMDITIPILDSDTIYFDDTSGKIEVRTTGLDYVPNRYTTNGLYLYAFDKTGNISQSADTGKGAYTVARRGDGGTLNVGDPVSQYNAVNKGFADANYVERKVSENGLYAYCFDTTGITKTRYISEGFPAYSLVERDEKGRVRTADPEGQNDAVTKSYADNRFRYTHFISVEFISSPGYIACKGTIIYVSNSSTPLTNINELPLNVTLYMNGLYTGYPGVVYNAKRIGDGSVEVGLMQDSDGISSDGTATMPLAIVSDTVL